MTSPQKLGFIGLAVQALEHQRQEAAYGDDTDRDEVIARARAAGGVGADLRPEEDR